MLHPGSHASVPPSLLAGVASAATGPDQDATLYRCGGWSLACWTATVGTAFWVAILCGVVVRWRLVYGFGFYLAPKIIVWDAASQSYLFTCLVQNRLKPSRIGQC